MTRAWALVAGLMMGVACLHPPHGLEGRLCEATPECGPGLSCQAGVCRVGAIDTSDAGDASVPEQLLSNGSFEQGLVDWAPLDESLLERTDAGRLDAHSMRVFAPVPATGSYLGARTVASAIAPVESGRTYCFEAWIQRESAREYFRLTLRRYDQAGAYQDEMGEVRIPPDDEWMRLGAAITAVPPFDHALHLRVHTPMQPDISYRVDDVRVWTAADGGCP